MTTSPQTESPAAWMLRAWQDGVNALLGGWTRQQPRTAGAAPWPGLASVAVRDSPGRVLDGQRELAYAQIELAGEWLRLPLALSGVAAPSRIGASYTRVVEAYSKLAAAYLSAAAPSQRSAADAAARATDTARQASRTVTETAHEVSSSVIAAQADFAAGAATAVEQAERAAIAATALPSNGGSIRQAAPPSDKIKGKINREGQRIYHLPGQANYERVEADMLFDSEAEAQAAGFRPSQR